MISKIEKKIYLKAILLLIVVFSLFYAGFVYFPQEIKILSSEIVSNRGEVEKLKSQNSQIEIIKGKNTELQKNINYISEYIIDYNNISMFVTEIKTLAKENNVQLDISISNNKEEKKDNSLLSLNYSIKVVGKFDDIMHFLGYLENLDYYLDIEKIKISNKSGTNITLNAVLKIYVENN